MLAAVAALATFAAVLAADDSKDAKKPKGLQIGVKKRVDPDKCTIKSRKGDSLQMHYTVSAASCLEFTAYFYYLLTLIIWSIAFIVLMLHLLSFVF